MTLTQSEAEKLACELRPTSVHGLPEEVDPRDLQRLCDHILSGDMKREIENAAYERAAQKLDWYAKDAEQSGAPNRPDRHLAYRNAANVVRSLIQPPAQKENGE